MNYARFDDTPELSAFHEEVRAFLDENLTPAIKEELRERRDEHHPDFFLALGRKGWLIPDFPREAGGAGLSYEQVEILDCELIARGAPTINHSTTRMVFPSILRFAQEPMRSEVIREVTSGKTALTLGYSEPSGGSDIAAAKTRAVLQADGKWLINGSKLFTTGAHHAKYIFLLAVTDPDAPKRRGLSMFLMPTDIEGVTVTPIHTLGERTNAVYFGDVLLPDVYRLGEVNDGWRVLQGPLEAEHGVGGGGGLRTHIDISALYGRRLALAVEAGLEWIAGQSEKSAEEMALTHYRLGQLLLRVEGSLAGDRLEGRVNSAENYIRGTSELLEIVAPAALANVTGPASRVMDSHLSAQVSSIYGGTVEVFRNLIARQMGLPAPIYRN
jgi:alkylation response protein AidB-like acyl-CoA dehydrogenase